MKQESIKSASLWAIKIGAFIVPFIPLYVSRVLFFPYITGKAFVFRIIVEVIFAVWIFLAIFYKEYRPKKSALLWAILVFTAVATLATIFGVNPYKSFWSNYERMEGLISYLHLVAYFLVLGHVFKKNDWKIFFNLFVVSGILESVYAWLQRFGYLTSLQGGIGRPDGTIGNPTYLAGYLIFIVFFCFWLALSSRRKGSKIFYSAAALFILATIYLTASRGPGLAIIIGGILASAFYLITNRHKNVAYKKVMVVVLAFLILAPGAIWMARNTNFIRNNPTFSRLTLLSLKERTISSRFTIWQMGLEGFRERPILGWGPDNFELVFSKYFKSELWRQEPWFDRSHNIIIDWLVNAGILGLFSYLSIFAAAIWLLWKGYKRNIFSFGELLLMLWLFFVYFFQNIFVFDNLATYLSFFAVLAFIQSSVAEADVKEEKKNFKSAVQADIKSSGIWVFLTIFISLIAVVNFINVRPLLANINLLEALRIQSHGDYPGVFEIYQKSLSYNTLGNKEIREQLSRFSLGVGGMEQVDASFRDKILRAAVAESQKSVLENPLDPRSYLFLGTLFRGVGLYDQALVVLNKARELSPAKQQIYFEVADTYIQKNDFKNAVQVLEKTHSLDDSFERAAMNLAAAYIINNEQQKADELLIKFYNTVNAPDIMLTQAYSKIKDYKRLAGIWKALAESRPLEISYWKNLAGSYLLIGAKMEAVKVLEKAISLNLGFKDEGESLIKDILSH